MTITLCVTSFQGKALGPERCKTFDERGGTIGRGEESDWVLHDPQRYLSGHHAAIVVRDGRFHLLDTSTNGVFVNDVHTPVGKGNSIELHDGDRVVMGTYQIEVSLAPAVVAATPHASVPPPAWTPPLAPVHEAVAHIAAADEADQLLRDLLGPAALPELGAAPPLPQSPRPLPPQTRSPTTEPDHVPAVEEYFAPPRATIERIPEDWDKQPETVETSVLPPAAVLKSPPLVAESMTAPAVPPPAIVAAPEAVSPPPLAAPLAVAVPVPAGVESPPTLGAAELRVLLSLLAAAGVKDVSVTEAEAGEVVDNLGKILREVVAGVMDVLLARAMLKSEFRMSMTMISRAENNPLKFSVNADEALRHLLVKQEPGYLSAVDSFQQAFKDIKNHQMEMIAGMRAAYEALLQRFDPQLLEEKFERRMRAGIVLPGTKKLHYWNLYCETYEEFAKDAEENFQRLFGEEFARAYEEQRRQLGTVQRTPP